MDLNTTYHKHPSPSIRRPELGDLLEDMVEAWGLPPFKRNQFPPEVRIVESNYQQWLEWYELVKRGETSTPFGEWLEEQREQLAGPPVEMIDRRAREMAQELPNLMRRVADLEKALNIHREAPRTRVGSKKPEI